MLTATSNPTCQNSEAATEGEGPRRHLQWNQVRKLHNEARAYRQLRTCPLSIPLLGITSAEQCYTDIASLFGCRTSSLACACTTSVVVYLLRKMNHHVFCYLDDFVGVAPTEEMAQQAYSDLMQLTNRL